ncbi:MAG: hypothetical protein SFY32_05210 [Bacteroidota bacterium]|nr:hypothetical protein [Bacteroidota bacterium]
MFKKLICSFWLVVSLFANAQTIDISKDWIFQFGDSIIWSKPEFVPNNWLKMNELGSVEDLGYPDFSGYAWFRKKVVIPSTFKSSANKFGYIKIVLGGIDDNDESYFNGKKIGASGVMPPNYVQGFYEFRVYKVNAADIMWDQQNLIAVRLFDHLGNGGFYTGPYVIAFPSNESIELSKSISGFNLSPDQDCYGHKVKIEDSLKVNALKFNAVRFESGMPGEIMLFCNNKYIGKSNKSENHRFLIPYDNVLWDKENEITYYVNNKEGKNKIIYSKNQFKSATNTDMLSVKLTNSDDIKYKTGTNNMTTIEVSNTANFDFTGELKILSLSDIGTIQSEINVDIQVPKQSKYTKNIVINLPFKGIYKVNYQLTDKKTNLIITGTLKKGYLE